MTVREDTWSCHQTTLGSKGGEGDGSRGNLRGELVILGYKEGHSNNGRKEQEEGTSHSTTEPFR